MRTLIAVAVGLELMLLLELVHSRKILLAVLIPLLGGCATDYWYRDMPNFAPKHWLTVWVDDPTPQCALGMKVNACTLRFNNAGGDSYALTYLRRGLSIAKENCVISHEARHVQGYNHAVRPEYATDCGNGSHQ